MERNSKMKIPKYLKRFIQNIADNIDKKYQANHSA